MKYLKLNNDVEMPILGLGTWKSDKTQIYSAIRWALKLGYKHFDCASVYGNEEEIGMALKGAMNEDGVKRDEFFITSKLWNNMHRKENVREALEKSLKDLGLEYIDLYLMHWPVVQRKNAIMPLTEEDMVSLEEVPIIETWRAMEELYKEGKVRAIGVSNFGIKRLEELLRETDINPMVLQVERHPYLQQNELLEFCDKNMIKMVAYSPLGGDRREVLKDEVVLDIAKRNNISVAQVVLAWNMMNGVGVVPKSVNEVHLRENIGALNVELDERDMEELSKINKNERFISADVFKIGWYKDKDILA